MGAIEIKGTVIMRANRRANRYDIYFQDENINKIIRNALKITANNEDDWNNIPVRLYVRIEPIATGLEIIREHEEELPLAEPDCLEMEDNDD